MTRVYFVRHAQSDCRSGSDRERGLTPEGLEDRRVVLDFLRDKPVDAFYCSPYRRSLDTILHYYDPSFNCASFMRFIDWMPFVVELDFSGTELVSKTEHVYVEKVFVP